MRTLVLVDTANLFHSIRMKHNGVLNYGLFFNWIETIHGSNQKIVYVADSPHAERFINSFNLMKDCVVCVKRPRLKRIQKEEVLTVDFDTTLITDALVTEYDKLIVCSSSAELLPMFEVIKNEAEIYIYACGIPKIFEEYGHVKEINVNFIEQRIKSA